MIRKIKKYKVLLFLLILSVPTFTTILRPGYFPMHDDMQAMRLLQMDKCIKDGQFPCRWVPDMGFGYGYPQFNYYSPLPYYFMESVNLMGLSYLDSIKAGFVASVLMSVVGMYLLGKKLWGEAGAFISTLIFVYAPYRALDMYVRGAVGEFWALSILPFIFWSTKKVFEGDKYAKILLALSIAALLMSHNITSLIFMPFYISWTLNLIIALHNSSTLTMKRIVKNLSFGFFTGFLISAFFWLPAVLEKSYVHVETLLQGYFNYVAHFAGIDQILFSTYWGFGSSEVGPYDDLSLSVGLMTWTIPLISLLLLNVLRKKKEFRDLLFLIILAFLSLFMIHPRSRFVWENIELLQFLQFPWRFLLVATFLFALSSGSIGRLLPKKLSGSIVILSVLTFVILILNASYFRPRQWLNIGDKEKFSGKSWQNQLTISIFDYLPKSAEKPPWQEAFNMPIFVTGSGRVLEGRKGTNRQEWSISAETDAVLRLPLYSFPGWEIQLDGSEKNYSYDNKLGLITIDVSKGNHFLTAYLKNTFIRSLANFLSLGGIFLISTALTKKNL